MKNTNSLFAFLLLAGFLTTGFSSPSSAALNCSDSSLSFTIKSDEIDTQDFFKQAFRNFTKEADHKETVAILKKISKQGMLSLTKEERLVLKKTRKYAAIVRSVTQITTEKHRAPEDFADFVVDFGHLNDHLVSDAPNAPAEAKELSETLLKAYSKIDFKELPKKLEFASKKSVRKYYKDLQDEANEIMARDQVSLEAFHRVRKIIKEYLSFYQLSNEIYGDKTYPCEFEFIDDLNNKMGELNDTFTENEINGVADEKETFIKFPADIRPSVESFFSHLKIN